MLGGNLRDNLRKRKESKIPEFHWQMIMKLESREGEGYHRLFPQDLLRLPRRAGKVPQVHVALTRVRVAIANFGRSVYSGFWVGLVKVNIMLLMFMITTIYYTTKYGVFGW